MKMNRRRLFVDTGHFRALVDSDDEFHSVAIAWRDHLKASPCYLVTTTAVLLELGNRFAKPAAFRTVMPVLKSVLADERLMVFPIELDAIKLAMQYREKMHDKSWGLVDCTSFLLMKSRGITEALACDRHFLQAGFRALLREGLPVK